jgi:rhodanese-related sulfurtransferase
MTDARALARGLGATAAVLGALAFVVGTPVRPARATRDTVVSAATRDAFDNCKQGRGGCGASMQPISALELAQWIRDGRPGLRVLDLRDASAFETRHIPSAESFRLMELWSVLPTPGETIVLYSDDDLRDAQGAAWLAAAGHARVHVVRGGMSAWMNEVIDPVVQGDSASAVAALSRYFGGVPRAATPGAAAARAARTRPRARVQNVTDEFGVVARRGC